MMNMAMNLVLFEVLLMMNMAMNLVLFEVRFDDEHGHELGLVRGT